jgi:hypothetical protein
MFARGAGWRRQRSRRFDSRHPSSLRARELRLRRRKLCDKYLHFSARGGTAVRIRAPVRGPEHLRGRLLQAGCAGAVRAAEALAELDGDWLPGCPRGDRALCATTIRASSAVGGHAKCPLARATRADRLPGGGQAKSVGGAGSSIVGVGSSRVRLREQRLA